MTGDNKADDVEPIESDTDSVVCVGGWRYETDSVVGVHMRASGGTVVAEILLAHGRTEKVVDRQSIDDLANRFGCDDLEVCRIIAEWDL